MIGESKQKLPQLIKSVETQYRMASTQKQVKPEKVEPIHLNKYVGYESNHLSVSIEKTEARVKHLRKVHGTAEQVKHDKVKLVIHRLVGTLAIHSYAEIQTKSAVKS